MDSFSKSKNGQLLNKINPPPSPPPNRPQASQMPLPRMDHYDLTPSEKVCLNVLLEAVMQKSLQAFYTEARIVEIAKLASEKIPEVIKRLKISKEMAHDLVRLALYDIIIFADDSGSMELEEDGQRIEELNHVISYASYISSIFDDDGVEVRFINSSVQGNGLSNSEDVRNLIRNMRFHGATPLGTNLHKKVLDPLVIKPARAKQLKKPVLVVTVTDGMPVGERTKMLHSVIDNAKKELGRTKYGSDALGLQFAQVGNDEDARKFLADLDVDSEVGHMVDCTSNFKVEKKEMESMGNSLTYEAWLVKMFVGAIDPKYDEMDE